MARHVSIVPPAPNWGQRLVWLRERLGLNQGQAAEQLGMAQGNLSLWETERAFPQKRSWARLAAFYQVTPYWLRYGKNPPEGETGTLNIFDALPEEVHEVVPFGHQTAGTLQRRR